MLSVVLAFYALAIKLGDYSAVAAGLIFFGTLFISRLSLDFLFFLLLLAFDFFNEMSNALVFHFSNYSALWVATPQNTMFQIMVKQNNVPLLILIQDWLEYRNCLYFRDIWFAHKLGLGTKSWQGSWVLPISSSMVHCCNYLPNLR